MNEINGVFSFILGMSHLYYVEEVKFYERVSKYFYNSIYFDFIFCIYHDGERFWSILSLLRHTADDLQIPQIGGYEYNIWWYIQYGGTRDNVAPKTLN